MRPKTLLIELEFIIHDGTPSGKPPKAGHCFCKSVSEILTIAVERARK
jgi:hypothetical protein